MPRMKDLPVEQTEFFVPQVGFILALLYCCQVGLCWNGCACSLERDLQMRSRKNCVTKC